MAPDTQGEPLLKQAGHRTTPSFADPSLPLTVMVTGTRWDEPPRMRHQVARQLMRWFNVLFVELGQGEPPAVSEMPLRRVNERLVVLTLSTRGRLPIQAYANVPFLHAARNRITCEQLAEVVQRYSHDTCILFNFVYDFSEVMELSLFDYKVYVCFDELPRMWRRATRPFGPKFYYHSRLYQFYENRVARRASRCLASHTPLEEKLRLVNPRTTLFLHGHEFKGELRAAANAKGSPIKVAFMGYITYNLMLDWFEAVLAEKDMHLTLIGPVNAARFQLDQFEKRGNFTNVPSLAGGNLLQKLAEMDVLVMPYNPGIPEVQVQTVSNKFFQYLAAGKPVVISDMPHYIQMPKGVIYRAKSAAEFVEKIRQAHAEDCPEFVEVRLGIARDNTWDKRGDALYSLIQQDMRAKGMKTED